MIFKCFSIKKIELYFLKEKEYNYTIFFKEKNTIMFFKSDCLATKEKMERKSHLDMKDFK